MGEFDYISLVEFRHSLESDNVELNECFKTKSWKAVHVLAGSAVEALLIDYLSTLPTNQQGQKDLLKIDLNDAIALCVQNKAITQRAADLCSVVRSYRNLIHPGRVVRLGEDKPDESSARIAVELVRMIAREISGRRTAVVGMTAEQVLTKIQNDNQAISILKHLLPDMASAQQVRLLKLIPTARREVLNDFPGEANDQCADRLRAAYRTVLSAQSASVVTAFVDEFAKLVREGDGFTISDFSLAFMHATDALKASPQYLDLLREHFLDRVQHPFRDDELSAFDGVIQIIRPDDAKKWLDPLVQTFISSGEKAVKTRVMMMISSANIFSPSAEVDEALEKRMSIWVKHHTNAGDISKQRLVEELQTALKGIPF